MTEGREVPYGTGEISLASTHLSEAGPKAERTNGKASGKYKNFPNSTCQY